MLKQVITDRNSKKIYIPDKSQETSKGLQDVSIGGSRFADGGTQLSIA